MKLKIILAFIFCTGAFASAQGTFVFDQQSTGATGGVDFMSQTPFGQSFMPNLNSIGFVELQLASAISTTVDVNIRSGSITGPILGTSLSDIVPANSSLSIFDFLFSSPITLTPGTKYYFEPVAAQTGVDVDITFIQYTGGDEISSGSTLTSRDLWFQEGIVVPEPSLAALFIVAGVLFWKRHKL